MDFDGVAVGDEQRLRVGHPIENGHGFVYACNIFEAPGSLPGFKVKQVLGLFPQGGLAARFTGRAGGCFISVFIFSLFWADAGEPL